MIKRFGSFFLFIIMNQYLLVCSSFKIAYSYYTVSNPIIELQSVTFRSLVSTFLCRNANKYMLTLSVSYQQDSVRLNKPVFIKASGSLLFDFVLFFLFFENFWKLYHFNWSRTDVFIPLFSQFKWSERLKFRCYVKGIHLEIYRALL